MKRSNVKLKKLRVEKRGGQTVYTPIAGGQRGADIYQAQISVETANEKDPGERAKVVAHLARFIPSKRAA